MLWCYQCKKVVQDNGNFICPQCGGGYLEKESYLLEEEGQSRSTMRELDLAVNPVTIYQGDFMRGGISIALRLNDLSSAHLLSFFRTILQSRTGNTRIHSRISNSSFSGQIGDYVIGNEDQVRALAEHLFSLDRQSLGSLPAESNYVSSLREVPFDQSDFPEDINSCMICLEQLTPGEKIIVLECGHPFHKECINPWLKIHSECPNCRYKLPSA